MLGAMKPSYEIVPGKGVGPFHLGTTLARTLVILRTNKNEFPKVEVSWDSDNILKSAVTIHFPHVDLYFPPSRHQVLTLISLTDLQSTTLYLTYEDHTLLGPNDSLNRGRISKVFGPTYAGGSDQKLSYPGISFSVSNPSNTPGRDDPVQSITITAREDDKTMQSPVVTSPDNSFYFPSHPISSVVLRPGKGITIHHPDPIDIIIGKTTAVDLRVDMGNSVTKYVKNDDRLAKMWGVGDSFEHEKGFVFWNYFQYGIDIMIDNNSTVVKIIVHSNIPGTTLFQRYARCPWVVQTPSGDLGYDSPLESFRANLSSKSRATYVDEVKLSVPPSPSPSSTTISTDRPPQAPANETGRRLAPRDESKRSHSASSGGSDGSDNKGGGKRLYPNGAMDLIDWREDAMVLDRLLEEGYEGVVGASQSRLIGFDGLILEEDQASKGICGALVWRDESLDPAPPRVS